MGNALARLNKTAARLPRLLRNGKAGARPACLHQSGHDWSCICAIDSPPTAYACGAEAFISPPRTTKVVSRLVCDYPARQWTSDLAEALPSYRRGSDALEVEDHSDCQSLSVPLPKRRVTCSIRLRWMQCTSRGQSLRAAYSKWPSSTPMGATAATASTCVTTTASLF